MYESHWDLDEIPFRGCLDPRFFYQSPTHEEALARLHFFLLQRLQVLLGEFDLVPDVGELFFQVIFDKLPMVEHRL